MSQVYLFLAQGFEEIEALTVVDLLRRADIDITTVSISDTHDVIGAHNISVTADALFSNLDFSLLIFFVGLFVLFKNHRKNMPLHDLKFYS